MTLQRRNYALLLPSVDSPLNLGMFSGAHITGKGESMESVSDRDSGALNSSDHPQ